MSPEDRVREALAGYGPLREVEVPGGLVFEWDGDPLARVVDGEIAVRAQDGWAAPAGDLQDAVNRAAGIVLAECVAGWHEQLRAGGEEANRAMLALTQHEPDREALQRLLLARTGSTDFWLRQLAFTCLGHVSRFDRAVLPEVVSRLEELLEVPEVAELAKLTLEEIEIFTHPFRLFRRVIPWVIFVPPGDEEVRRQLALVEAEGGLVQRVDARSAGEVSAETERDVVIVVESAEQMPSLLAFVLKRCDEAYDRTHIEEEDDVFLQDPDACSVHFVLEFDGDMSALVPQLQHEDLTVHHEPPYVQIW
ncbi:hypothetical protein ACIA8G_28850 [Lentzea sp. NPDC051213]|uniref:hypothetical protein n=1 Tax=Lentzea sp. NPDC051213 TaxID=3364126 RepID=UPI00378D9064